MARTWRSIVGSIEAPPADNDPVTITRHPDANTLLADFLRAKNDFFAANHAATEAIERVAECQRAIDDARRAYNRMLADNDAIELELPGEIVT